MRVCVTYSGKSHELTFALVYIVAIVLIMRLSAYFTEKICMNSDQHNNAIIKYAAVTFF